MASLQLVRKLHLQAAKYSTPSIVGRLKNLVGIGQKQADSNVSQQVDVDDVQGEFMFDDVEKRMLSAVSQSFSTSIRVENWQQQSLLDLTSKFNLLKYCHNEFGVIPPNNIVHESKSVEDILKYYLTLRKPEIVPEVWKFQNEKLPPNLTFHPNRPYKPAKKIL